MLCLAAQAARMTWILLSPASPVAAPAMARRAPTDPSVLGSFDAFGTSGSATPASGGQGGDGFRLFGVRSGGPDGGSAIIAGPDGVQKAYSVGETIIDGVTLVAVAADHVELSRGGARSTLSFPDIQ